jgi:hypothetical protein
MEYMALPQQEDGSSSDQQQQQQQQQQQAAPGTLPSASSSSSSGVDGGGVDTLTSVMEASGGDVELARRKLTALVRPGLCIWLTQLVLCHPQLTP